jgi:hypothetical protein
VLFLVNNAVEIDDSIFYALTLVQDYLVLIRGLRTLPVVIPAPNVHFTLAVDYHAVSLTRGNIHNWAIVQGAFRHALDPL